jgi:hypothetical protein
MHEDDKSGWKVPMTDKKQLGDITMDGATCRLFEGGIDHLIEVCIGDHRFGVQYSVDWKECMGMYRQVRSLMTSRCVFEFDDVCAFVQICDAFMARYVALTGRDGMTNYFHMLRDGHVAYYLLKYKNLYRLSQQGWENINSVMKRSFHRGTQKGGGRVRTSKLRPVFFRVLRAALWRMGHMCGMLQHFGWVRDTVFKYGVLNKLPKFENIETREIRAYTLSVLKFGDTTYMDGLVDAMDIHEDTI